MQQLSGSAPSQMTGCPVHSAQDDLLAPLKPCISARLDPWLQYVSVKALMDLAHEWDFSFSGSVLLLHAVNVQQLLGSGRHYLYHKGLNKDLSGSRQSFPASAIRFGL